jgi:hypothetical protein
MRAANRCRGPFLLTLAMAVSISSLAACERKTPAEKVGDKIENAGDKIEDKLDEAN